MLRCNRGSDLTTKWLKKKAKFTIRRVRLKKWRGGRAVECTGLENRQTFAGFVSSNLTLSANYNFRKLQKVSNVRISEV